MNGRTSTLKVSALKVSPPKVIALDAETKVHEAPGSHKPELRLWLRMLTCTMMVENTIRAALRSRFDATLPRFDLMAQLEKAENGMTLSEVSRRMMVSNGNVTALVERLMAAGLVARRISETDRRSQVIWLTPAGHQAFAAMAAEHEAWVADMFSGLTADEARELMRLLAKTKQSVQRASSKKVSP